MPDLPTVAEAMTTFTDDAKASHLATETIRKDQNLLERRRIGNTIAVGGAWGQFCYSGR